MLLLTTPKSAPITSVPFNNFSDENGDDDGSKSDARCTYGLAGRNNMNMDSRHTDNSGRMDAQSTHRDNG